MYEQNDNVNRLDISVKWNFSLIGEIKHILSEDSQYEY